MNIRKNFLRQCCVAKRHEHEHVPRVLERMTKVQASSAQTAMKIKVVVPPYGEIITVGVKTPPLRGSVVPAEVQRAPGR